MIKVLGITLALAVVAALGLWWRNDNLSSSLAASELSVTQLTAAAESRKKTQKLLLDLDTKHTKEQTDADAKNLPMLTTVAAGTQRVFVKASCPTVRTTPTATSKPDAESRAELDPTTAERILHTGVDGDNAIRQLTTLQEYVSTVCLGGAPHD